VSIDLARSTHPDLLEETLAEQAAAAEPATSEPASQPGRRGRRSTPAASSAASAPAPSTTEEPASSPPPAEPATDHAPAAEPAAPPGEPSASPDWLAELQGKTDPKEILTIARQHVSREDLANDPFFQGWIGDLANKRARQLLAEQDQQKTQRERQAALERGDLYALGQMTATELQQQRAAEEAQAQQALSPLMQDVAEFQRGFPQEVQAEISGKQYPTFKDYLQAVAQAAIRHGFDDELKRREPALRKAFLSETVGSEPTPEREGGRAPSVREITDEQLARMSLEESDQYLDERGQPRPGVQLRLTRGVPLTRR
jgi:hypothetical protein